MKFFPHHRMIPEGNRSDLERKPAAEAPTEETTVRNRIAAVLKTPGITNPIPPENCKKSNFLL